MTRVSEQKEDTTARLTTSELRKDLSTVLNKVAFGGERIILERNNKDIAVLVSLEDLALLRELEDRADVAAMEESMKEPGPNIPWEQVKNDLGI